MTQKERTTEEIREDLAQAEEALRRLANEEANIQAAAKEAADASRDAWQEAALSGKPLKAGSDFARIRAREAELPGLLWAAKMRALELQIELCGVGIEEARHLEGEASARAAEIRPRLGALRLELKEAEGEASYQQVERRDLGRRAGELRRQLAALEHNGPDAPKRPTTLKPRPTLMREAE